MFQTPINPRRRISPGRKGSHLPKGECRFILLHPELQQQRCACVGFCLNDSTPGTTCECGHQSCFHEGQKEGTVDREEIESLRERIRLLEEEFSREKQNGDADLVCRIGELEDTMDRHKTEMETEIKGIYRDVGRFWQNAGNLQDGLQKWTKRYDDHIEALMDANHSCHSDIANFQKRLIEADDTSMKLEERIEILEAGRQAVLSHMRKDSASPTPELNKHEQSEAKHIEEHINEPTHDLTDRQPREAGNEQSRGLSEDSQIIDGISKSWTVHVSLLPKASTPMPFEKDTNAYKRCLSRGLHRMLAVPGYDAESFNRAVSDAFHDFLLGRPWMPLDAKLCDAPPLIGLPMLRPLPKHEIDVRHYNYHWLSQRCATTTPNGKIVDLYIAMIDESLTWNEIYRAPAFIQGLESCWQHDKVLDQHSRQGDDPYEVSMEEEASAGDILPNMIRQKRPSSVLSQSNFGSTEGELFAKRARLKVAESVDRLRQMTEAV